MKSTLLVTGTALLALAVGGCGSVNSMSETFKSDAGWFSKPFGSVLTREDGSGTMSNKNLTLGPTGPVPPEELVNPDGSCAATATAASPPADRAVGSMAGDLAGSAMPAAGPAEGVMLGGIALGMTECQAVRRAGMPSNVAITMGDSNERKTVLTYLGGQWPGIYTFASGRLKIIDAVPVAERPKPAPKRRAPARRS